MANILDFASPVALRYIEVPLNSTGKKEYLSSQCTVFSQVGLQLTVYSLQSKTCEFRNCKVCNGTISSAS